MEHIYIYIYKIVDEILEVEECGLPVDHSAEEEGNNHSA